MSRRGLALSFLLIIACAAQGVAASYPLIVQISPTTSMTRVAAALGATVVDGISGSNIYLLDVPFMPTEGTALLLGIQWLEPNTAVILPGFVQTGMLRLNGNPAPDWYKDQPAMRLIQAGEALSYSTGRGIVIADINSQIDYGHPALQGHLIGGWDFVTNRPARSAAQDQSTASFLDRSNAVGLDQSSASFLDESGARFLNQSSASFLDGQNPAYSH